MGNADDDDIVWLPAAWTIQHRRNRREIQLEGLWDAHSRPYTGAFKQQLCWAEHAAKGGWTLEDWIVEKLFMAGHVGLLVGDAGTGKSLAALDLMISAVSGGKWLGHFETMTTPVVYLAGEGKIDENTAHIMGLLLGRGEDIKGFMRRCGNRIQLLAPDSVGLTAEAPLSSDAWWKNVQALVSSTYPAEARPKLWIFDPLLALINSTDKADDVRPFIARCRWLAEAAGAYVLLIHHTKKGQGSQLSRREKVRGESMWTNLCDDVLYLEQDTDDPKLAHLYANKLKRGPADDTKPLCHVMRSFTDVPEHTFDHVLRDVGVTRTGEESPRSLHHITLRYLPYSAELHKKDGDDVPADVEPHAVEPKRRAAKPAQPTGPDKSSWDADHHRVWNVISASDGPMSTNSIQQAIVSEEPEVAISRTKIQTRVDALIGQDLLVAVPIQPEGPGRPGTGYLLKSRI